ncbi:MAG: ABC transporter ATP-binding protein [Candidatus Firestonebacteria bacterium]|nr:ABC transporter ATP-binding protein [Candidatus Firestonebacteria bacterium]
MKTDEILLKIENLKTYFNTIDGVVKAVDYISFSLQRWESIGIVGESGCGKSVTALSIMKLILPPGKIMDGKVIFNNIDLLLLSNKELRKIRGKEIGIIFQEPFISLNPLFSIGHQLTESLILHRKIKKKEAMDEACRLLEIVGIPSPREKLREYPFQLSGGMCQRIMIAMALSCNPLLLIADEPTTALDVTIQAQILDILRMKKEEFNTSLLLITHDMGIIAETVDRVIVMYAGKIIETGTVKSIFKNPLHPYTRGLLASIPKTDINKKNKIRLDAIDGAVPDLYNLSVGCSFQPRCHLTEKICSMRPPALKNVNDDCQVSCWRY